MPGSTTQSSAWIKGCDQRCMWFLREMAQTQVKILQNWSRSYFIKTSLSPLTTLHKKKNEWLNRNIWQRFKLGQKINFQFLFLHRKYEAGRSKAFNYSAHNNLYYSGPCTWLSTTLASNILDFLQWLLLFISLRTSDLYWTLVSRKDKHWCS